MTRPNVNTLIDELGDLVTGFDLTPMEKIVALLRVACAEALHDDCLESEWQQLAAHAWKRARAEHLPTKKEDRHHG